HLAHDVANGLLPHVTASRTRLRVAVTACGATAFGIVWCMRHSPLRRQIDVARVVEYGRPVAGFHWRCPAHLGPVVDERYGDPRIGDHQARRRGKPYSECQHGGCSTVPPGAVECPP